MEDIVQRLRARADADENCVTACIYSAAAQANCGTDIHCICTSSAFKSSALTCLNQSCSPADYEVVLDSMLGACATGGLDAVSSLSEAFLSSASRTVGPSATNTRAGSGSNTGSASSSSSSDDNKGGSNIGAIVGGVVGGLVVVALFAGLIFYLVRRARRPKPTVYAAPYTVPQGAPGGNDPKTPGAGGDPAQQLPLMANANVYGGGGGYPSLYTGGPTSTATYSNAASSPTMPSPHPASMPPSELGYVPPQSFAMYGAPAAQSQYPGYSQQQQQQQPSLAPPSTGGTSRPSTGSATDYAYQPQTVPFTQYQNLDVQQPQRTSLYAGPVQQQQQWPADVKRPLQVMSAESESQSAGAGSSTPRPADDAPPPVYRQ